MTQTINSGGWQHLAACRGLDPNLFIPEDAGDARANQTAAKAVCKVCPVVVECLELAISYGPSLVGIYGGTTQRERRKVFASDWTPIEHGTSVGFHRERRLGLRPCRACQTARERALETPDGRWKDDLGELLQIIHETVSEAESR